MVQGRPALLIVLCLFFALVSGCTSLTASPSATAQNATITVPRNQASAPTSTNPNAVNTGKWQTVGMLSEGFSVMVPPNWFPLATDQASLEATIDLATKQNPQAAENVRTQVKTLLASGAKLIVFDLTPANSKSGFTTVVNIVKQSSDKPVSLDSYITASIADLGQIRGVIKPVTHRRTNLPAGEAEEIRYKVASQKADSTPITLSYLQHVIIDGNKIFVLTYATTADQADKYAETFNKLAQSFQLLKQ